MTKTYRLGVDLADDPEDVSSTVLIVDGTAEIVAIDHHSRYSDQIHFQDDLFYDLQKRLEKVAEVADLKKRLGEKDKTIDELRFELRAVGERLDTARLESDFFKKRLDVERGAFRKCSDSQFAEVARLKQRLETAERARDLYAQVATAPEGEPAVLREHVEPDPSWSAVACRVPGVGVSAPRPPALEVDDPTGDDVAADAPTGEDRAYWRGR